MKLRLLSVALLLATSCRQAGPQESSVAKNFLSDDGGPGWRDEDSPYDLMPGTTISVCDTGVVAGATATSVDAAKIWLQLGGRDALKVYEGCDGDRIIKLVPAGPNRGWYGRTSPLAGNVHQIEVADEWAGHWTANHEMGHVFGFAHVFNGTVSIMDSENNGQFMNGGNLSAYDKSEAKRLLSLPVFSAANQAWGFAD